MTEYVVMELERYTNTCPTQFDGKYDDGDVLYIRYRWGYLSVCKGGVETEYEIFGAQVGDAFDGVLSDGQLIEATRGLITWPGWFTNGHEQRDAERDKRIREQMDAAFRAVDRLLGGAMNKEDNDD